MTFDRWHTAAGDAVATTGLIVSLLDRATRWGQNDLSRFLRVWDGTAGVWLDLAPTGRVPVRDPVTFPPGGKQPGHPSLFKFETGQAARQRELPRFLWKIGTVRRLTVVSKA